MSRVFFLAEIYRGSGRKPMVILGNRLYVSNRGALYSKSIFMKVMDIRLVDSI